MSDPKTFHLETRTIDGEEVVVRVYESGTVIRNDKPRGGLIAGPPEYRIRTTEQARAMNARFRESRKEATRRGIAEGLGLELRGGAEEWERLTSILAEQFAKSKNLRGMAETYLQLGRAAGYISDKSEESETDNSALVGALVSFLRSKLPRPEIVDAEVTHDTDEPA